VENNAGQKDTNCRLGKQMAQRLLQCMFFIFAFVLFISAGNFGNHGQDFASFGFNVSGSVALLAIVLIDKKK
jgi:hypothetical protein